MEGNDNMSIVTLVSGGLDSTLMEMLIIEEGIEQYPLFVDYGQLCKEAEWKACLSIHKKYNFPVPKIMDLKGFGKLISSGLTDSKARLNEDAFLPGRNLLFLLAACAYAFQKNSNSVAIGLLDEKYHLFPDQTEDFIRKAESLMNISMGFKVKIITPLMNFSKLDVIKMSKVKGITGTYSCHAGVYPPCGRCISCMEIRSIR